MPHTPDFPAPTQPPVPATHAGVYVGRLEINWPYLVERRPLNLQLYPELPSYLLLPEVHTLFDTATHPRDHLLASFLWHTGARVSEALAVTPAHLNITDEWSSGVILDVLKKRGRPRQVKRETIRKRWVPITSPSFALDLQRYITGQGLKAGDRLFPFTWQ